MDPKASIVAQLDVLSSKAEQDDYQKSVPHMWDSREWQEISAKAGELLNELKRDTTSPVVAPERTHWKKPCLTLRYKASSSATASEPGR